MRDTIGDSYTRRDGTLETSYPTLAAPLGANINAASWTWSAYTQIVAATTADFVASQCSVNVIFTIQIAGAGVLQAVNGEIELATGAAAAEVAFATIPFAIGMIEVAPGTSTQTIVGCCRAYPIGPTLIPSGTRIASRARMNVANTAVTAYTRLWVIGYDGGAAPAGSSTYTIRGQQTGIQKGTSVVTPAGSTLTVTPGIAAWGNWTQIIAAATGEPLLMGMSNSPANTSNIHWTIYEIGTGGAGSEVTRCRMWFPSVNYCNAGFQLMTRPLLIKPGERVAVRAWSASNIYTNNTQYLYEQH